MVLKHLAWSRGGVAVPYSGSRALDTVPPDCWLEGYPNTLRMWQLTEGRFKIRVGPDGYGRITKEDEADG
jgi:hypothetical protein